MHRDQRRIPNHYRPNFFPKNFRSGQHRKMGKNMLQSKSSKRHHPETNAQFETNDFDHHPETNDQSLLLTSELPVEPQPWDKFLQSINRTLD